MLYSGLSGRLVAVLKASRNAPQRRSGARKNLKKRSGAQNVRIFTGTLDLSPFRGPMH